MSDLQNLLDDSHESSVLGAIAHPAQVNILGAYAGAAETANRIYNVQDQQAQKAWGNALQQSVGPDGTVDYDKARTIAAGNPLATMGMMKGLHGAAELAGAQQTQGANANGLMVNAITAALKGDDAGLHDRVAAGMQQLIDAGAVPRGRGMTALTRLPNDPAALRAHLEQQRISLLPPDMQQPAIYGTRPMVSAGGHTEMPVVPPISSGQPGPTVVHSASPESGQDLVDTPTPLDAKGQPIPRDPTTGAPTAPPVSWRIDRVPRSTLPGSKQYGQPGTGSQAPTPPPAGTKIPGGYVPPGGAQPAPAAPLPAAPAAAPAPAQPAPAPAAAPAVPGMPLTTGAGLEAGAAHAAAARDKANNYQQTIQPIEGALGALAGADTGKASEVLNNLRGVIQDVTPSFLQRMLPGNVTDPERRKKFDEANKYLTQMQLGAPGGSRSDTGLATAGAASPSVHISNAAAIEVGRAILAQRRMEQTGTMLFNQTGQPPGAYDQFMNKWATSVDPRAFVADKLNASERAQVIKDMGGTSSPAYQQYRQSYQDAVTAGVIRHGG